MKNNCMIRKIRLLLTVMVIMCLTSVPVHAAGYSDSVSVDNHGSIGAVDIELRQTFPKEQTMIVPNQTVSLESSVVNKGKPAWIRVKIEYPRGSKSDLEVLDDSLITFAEGKWKKIGSYWYLTESVKSGAVVPFTKSITFPSDWDNSMTNAQIGMVFTAEAVQESNFTPDFKSNDPWHGTVIEAFDSNNYEPRSESVEQFAVVYKNGADGLVRLGDNFFSHWGDLMPGDELDGTAKITNRMNIPVKIYFGMENTGDHELIDQIHITIKNDKDVIYDGPLSGKVKPAVMLLEYAPGKTTDFSYHISIPKELDNEYALSDFKVVWTFSAEEVIEVIKTGESGMMAAILGFGIVAGMAGILLVLKYRTRKRGGMGDV